MKLYGYPGTCSLAPHIALHELGIPHEFKLVDIRKGEGQLPDFLELNPMGQVPVLVGEHGEVLTEVSAILIYLFQQHGQIDVPIYQSVRHLSFISSELHRNFYPQFFAKQILGEDSPQLARLVGHFEERVEKRWDYVDDLLPAFEDFEGGAMGPADPYLYTVCRWWLRLGHSFERHQSIPGFLAHMESRESVRKALALESLEPVANL